MKMSFVGTKDDGRYFVDHRAREDDVEARIDSQLFEAPENSPNPTEQHACFNRRNELSAYFLQSVVWGAVVDWEKRETFE